MKRTTRIFFSIFIASFLFMMNTNVNSSDCKENVDEKKGHETTNDRNNILDRIVKLADENSAYRADYARKESTRGDDDLVFYWYNMRYFSNLSDAPYEVLYRNDDGYYDRAWGVKGEEITYTIWIKNNGTSTITNYDVRMTAIQAVANGNRAWKINQDDPAAEFENQIKGGGPLAGGAHESIQFSWTPECAGKIRLMFEIEYNSDPAPEDNWYSWWFYIMHEYNTVESGSEQGEWTAGNGWSVSQLSEFEDPEPTGHSAPTVWEYGAIGSQALEYSLDLSTIRDGEAPYFADAREGWGTKGVFLVFSFAGSAPASTWAFGAWNTTSQSWDEDWTGAQQINEGWWGYRYQDNERTWRLSGIFLDQHYCTAQFKYRFTGTNLYVDDLWVVSLEHIEPAPPNPQLSVDLVIKEGEDFNDVDDNDIEDKEFAPGAEFSWNVTLMNTAPTGTVERDGEYYPIGATISGITFAVPEKPEGWEIEFLPESITQSLEPGDPIDFEMTVTLPEDARASRDILRSTGDMVLYLITVTATATPEITDPEATPDILHKEISVETLVTAQPSVTLTSNAANQTGEQGAKLEYEVSVENSGNCNVSVDLDVIDPVGLGSAVELDMDEFDLEYEESQEVSADVSIPGEANAGFYTFEITAEVSVDDIIMDASIELVIGVEQIFGLEIHFKSKTDDVQEVDPSKPEELAKIIEFEIKNSGNGKDTARFEVTAEDDADNDWIDMEENTIILDSSGGIHAEEDFAIQFTIPEDAAVGYHVFSVKAVSETDITGNTETEEKMITFTILRPDLTVSTMIGLNPNPPVLGMDAEITARIYNNGTVDATSFSVYLYITVEGGNEEFAGYQNVNSILAGQHIDLSPFEYVFDEFEKYTIRVMVDPQWIPETGNVTEMDETNNEAQRTIMVIAPDLEIKKEEIVIEALDDATVSEYAKVGSGYSITVTVENDGDADASDVLVNFKMMYLDKDQNEQKEFEENVTIDSIKAGKTGTATFTWTPRLWNTEYIPEFTVDPENEIPEEDDKNNDWTSSSGPITPKKPRTDTRGSSGMIIVGITAVVVIGAIVGVLVVLSKRKKKE